MTVRKQISYRKILRRWLWVTLAVLTLPAWSAATPTPDAATQNLLSAARSWAAQRQSVPESQLQASVLDPRVSPQGCGQTVQIDTPFPNPETVRVRCAQPAWQVYVRVVVAPTTPGTSTGGQTSATAGNSINASPLGPPKMRPVVVVTADVHLLFVIVFAMALISLTRTATRMLRGWVLLAATLSWNLRSSSSVFQHMVRLPVAFFEKRHVGDVIGGLWLAGFGGLFLLQTFDIVPHVWRLMWPGMLIIFGLSLLLRNLYGPNWFHGGPLAASPEATPKTPDGSTSSSFSAR